MTCYYCKQSLGISSEYWHVRQSTKPKRVYKRWQTIGYCCETCELDGKPLTIESVK